MTATLGRTLRYDEVAVGDALPELSIDLSPTVIISTAIASRDYQDVHHDRDLAQQKGSKDIFLNILSTNGFVGRYVTDWAGPNALLQQVNIRLGVPSYAYDKLTITGKVVSKQDGHVELAVVGSNSLGDHVTGNVRLLLPS